MPPKPPKGQLFTDLNRPFPPRLDPQLYLLPDMTRFLSHDPDAFSYKPDRPDTPVESFSLECEQWRHGIAEKCFDGAIFAAHDQDEIQGAIECDIHAENLSSPAKKIIPVRTTVKRERTRDDAAHLVTNLSNRASIK